MKIIKMADGKERMVKTESYDKDGDLKIKGKKKIKAKDGNIVY